LPAFPTSMPIRSPRTTSTRRYISRWCTFPAWPNSPAVSRDSRCRMASASTYGSKWWPLTIPAIPAAVKSAIRCAWTSARWWT